MSQQNTRSFPGTVSAASRAKLSEGAAAPIITDTSCGSELQIHLVFLNIERNQAGNTHTEGGEGGLLWVEVEQTCARLQKNI